jgi:hypothetical protein
LSNGDNKTGRHREYDATATQRLSVRGTRPGAATTSIALPSVTRGSVYEPSLRDLRPEKSGVRRLTAVALTGIRQSESLLPIHPGVELERVKPASFSHIKALQRTAVRYPAANLQPAKLIDARSAPVQAAKPVLKAKAARAAAGGPAGGSIPMPPMTTPWEDNARKSLTGSRSEPLWHALFSPDSNLNGAEKNEESKEIPAATLRKSATVRSHSAFDWGSAGDIDLEGLTASRPTRQRAKQPVRKRYWMWQTVEGVFLSKTFARSLAAITILLFASTVDVPWNEWVKRLANNVKQPIAAAMDQMSKPIQERAAFQITDEFTNGVENWTSTRRLNVDPAGWLKMQQGLALNSATAGLTDYRLDFDAKIQNKAVGWVVRAPNTSNFYEFKLVQSGTTENPEYSLARYSMLDGARTLIADGIQAPSHLMRPDDFNRISVRVIGESVTTLINGWGVDHWRDSAIPRGGVGLIADAGESALVRKMTVSGNDDTWGLILYGAIESMRSVQDLFGQSPAPAMILFYRPGGMLTTPATTQAFLVQGR